MKSKSNNITSPSITSSSDFGYLATILFAISVVLRLVGFLQIISVTIILTISLRSRALGHFCLSKVCSNSSGSFCHGIWKLSTQCGTKGEQLIEDDEVAVDDAGEDWGGTEVGEDWTGSGEEHTKFGVEAIESVKVQQSGNLWNNVVYQWIARYYSCTIWSKMSTAIILTAKIHLIKFLCVNTSRYMYIFTGTAVFWSCA